MIERPGASPGRETLPRQPCSALWMSGLLPGTVSAAGTPSDLSDQTDGSCYSEGRGVHYAVLRVLPEAYELRKTAEHVYCTIINTNTCSVHVHVHTCIQCHVKCTHAVSQPTKYIIIHTHIYMIPTSQL